MRRRPQVPRLALERSIQCAKRLVEAHSDPGLPPGERLREIAKKLKVSRIEAGAIHTSGFLKRLPDRTFAIYYSSDCSLARRRFTVAHELGHLVLEKFHKHVGREHAEPGMYAYHCEVEKAVDRLAAELLMPECLVVRLITEQCQLQRTETVSGIVNKRTVLQTVGETLGVSEYALVLRLLELPTLLAVLFRVQWSRSEGPRRPRYLPISRTQHSYMRLVTSFPDPSKLAAEEDVQHQVQVQTEWGLRVIHCHSWQRPSSCNEAGEVETWVFGWTWNAFPLPAWDDGEHKGGTPDVIRVRDFADSCARPK